MIHPRGGETGLVTRRLAGTHDAVALHAGLAEAGAPLLFRRTGGRALILVEAALRLEASGLGARLEAASEGGTLLLDAIGERLEEFVVGREDQALTFAFPRCIADDEAARAAAATPLEVVRAMLFGAAPLDRDEPFALVAAGIVGFDHVDMVESLPPHAPGDFPDILFLLAESAIVVEP